MSVQSVTFATKNADLKVEKQKDVKKSEELLFNSQTEENKTNEEDAVEFLKEETETSKVSFKEGLSLVGKGFLNKLKSMGKAIIEHPARTLATAAGTAALLAAAPIIGISAATAGAFLAIGFGAFAIGKTVVDVAETVKDNKEGRYDEVREDLQEIGGDGVDLALTLPFMPKAIKQVSRFGKYGTTTVGLNTELIGNLRKSRNLSEVQMNFAKANTKINYEMIGNEMGLAAKPELVFKKMDYTKGGFYEPAEGKMYVNENQLESKMVQAYKQLSEQIKNKDLLNTTQKFKVAKSINSEEILRHELQHYQQFSDIASVYGEDALKSAIADYYAQAVKKYGAKTTTPDADLAAIEKPVKTEADIIKPNYETNSAATAPKEFKGAYEAIDDINKGLNEFYEKYNIPTEEYQLKYERYLDLKDDAIANKCDYMDALKKASEETSIPKNVIENMTNGDMSAFNSELYQQMAKSNASTHSLADTQRVDSYLQGLVEKVNPNEEMLKAILEKYNISSYDMMFKTPKLAKAQLEFYKSNPLEKEAYAAQEAFASKTLALRPNTASNIFAQEALTEEKINSYTDDANLEDLLFSLDKKGTVAGQVFNLFEDNLSE